MTETNGRLKLPTTLLIQVGVWIVSIMLAYNAINARVAVLEVKYDLLSQQLASIGHKLDRLIEIGRKQ